MVNSNLLLALLAGTASACKFKLYAASISATAGTDGFGNVTTLEFAFDGTTKKGTLKELGSTPKCGEVPTWQHVTIEGGKTTVECIDEAWARQNGSITQLSSQQTDVFTIGSNHTTKRSPVHIEPASFDSGEYRYLSNFYWTAPGITVVKKGSDGTYTTVDDVRLPATAPTVTENPGTISQIHQTILHPSGEYLIAEDYGLGFHKVYSIDQKTGKLTWLKDEVAKKGVRHGVFTSPGGEFCNETTFFHSINEVENVIDTYQVSHYDDGKGLIFKFLQQVTTFPGRTGDPKAAASEIVEANGFIVASNRKDPYLKVTNPDPTNSTLQASDALVTYKINDNGTLTAGELSPSGGVFPRHFSLSEDGSFIAVAHAISNSLTIFSRDTATGKIGNAIVSKIFRTGINHIAWGEQE